MYMRRYEGTLKFPNSGDPTWGLDVQTLIVREAEIGFSVASTSREFGAWKVESGKPAVRIEDGSFQVKSIWAFQDGVRCSSPWNFVFRIKFEAPGQYIEVFGELIQDRLSYQFDGELTAIE